jgi:hypothetical protein
MIKIIQILYSLLLKANQRFHQISQKKDRQNLKVEQLQIHIIKVKIHQIFYRKRKILILQTVNNSQSRRPRNFKEYKLHLIIQM